MASPVNRIMNTEMTRKEFLAHMGAALMAASGVAGLLKAFTDKPSGGKTYGAGSYGGRD